MNCSLDSCSRKSDQTGSRSMRRAAFTLIELLVVVSIIVILIAILVPAMERAMKTAARMKCLSNQDGMGNALGQLLTEKKGRYPELADWSGLAGNLGRVGVYSGTTLDVQGRPLNEYLGIRTNGSKVPIAECPSDAGDASPYGNWSVSAYLDWGMSYLPAFAADWHFMTGKLFGFTGDPNNTSIQFGQIERASNKMVIADWMWPGNRDVNNPRGVWHNEKGRRLANVLFADGHAEYLDLDSASFGPMNPSQVWTPGKPSYLWW